MSSTPSPDRYGSTRRTSGPIPWAKWILTGLVVLAGVGLAYIAYTKFAVKEIEGEQVAFDVVDQTTMNIRFTVTRDDPSEPAVCIIRTRSKDGSETGRREVYVGPSDSGTVEITAPVRASQPPAMGDLYGCSLDVPDYLHAG
ncbi:DUF4307 domain-containing protein [Rhodococcus sp. TAF43]|jgi:Domain of unknown function (DUF4307)|uniref:DUF4307 domain-containing protein n=1 Tax=unclassified Rhodococcus (in: high G+C Gram-positive bacteria) TaxID=192944 RepID=UPI0015821DE1|nr:DUF4307 domain-containing protein [Rhodococcus sp. W8901]QKT10640.1 DUF4307 domain-containing protein [Rhodococcus sp. W8901]